MKSQAGAVKPWVGAIRAPEHPPIVNSEAPNVALDLAHVYGYSAGCIDAKGSLKGINNLFYTQDGNVVYPAAALGVKLSTSSQKQSYFRGHDDDILCLAISHDRYCTGFISLTAS